MKKILILLLILISGCTQQTEIVDNQLPLNVEEGIETPSEIQIEITAKQWEFIPNTIEANKGDKVILKIISEDVTHGFKISEYDINENIEPGEETTIEFIADKTGEFNFYCNVPCGSGHSTMNGKLVVNE